MVLSGLTTITQSRTLAVVVPSPDVVIAKTHTGNFRQGDIGDTYSIVVLTLANNNDRGGIRWRQSSRGTYRYSHERQWMGLCSGRAVVLEER